MSPRKRQLGFTVMEVAVAVAILVTALMGLLAAEAASIQAVAFAKERALALRAAQNRIADMRSLAAKSGLQAVYTSCTPRGFKVDASTQGTLAEKLTPEIGDPDQLVGFVWFPGDDVKAVSADPVTRARFPAPPAALASGLPGLREDVDYTTLAPFPGVALQSRDLNGDGVINANVDVSGTAVLLPVVVVVEWRTSTGKQSSAATGTVQGTNMRVLLQTTLRKP